MERTGRKQRERPSARSGPPFTKTLDGYSKGSVVKVWIVVLKVFGYLWTTLAVIAIFIGIVGVGMKGGFSAVQELLSPFNVVNWVVTVITLAPGIGALAWAKNLSEKQSRVRSQPSNP